MNKYEKISNEIRTRVLQGDYPLEHPIPDEVSLTKEFECSRMTMKRALDVLVAEGLLFRKQGHGTFIVQSPKREEKVNVISEESLGLTKLLPDAEISSVVVAFSVQLPEREVAEQLAIGMDEQVYEVIRLRKVDDEPFVIERTYMPISLIPGITEEVLHASVYNHIHEEIGLKIGGAHRRIRADKPNELDKQYLGCHFDDPVLEVEQIGYLNNGQPFEYSFSRHRYDKFVFTTVTIRK